MELKNFLEQKNYANLLPELEANFTITPKGPKPWSIMGIIRERFGPKAGLNIGGNFNDTCANASIYSFGEPGVTHWHTNNGHGSHTHLMATLIQFLKPGASMILNPPSDMDKILDFMESVFKHTRESYKNAN